MQETKLVPISLLENNTGQIKGLPKNPRFIKDDRFKKLIKSIADLPEMMELRPLLVYPNGKKWVVIGGNMRLRALLELKYTDVPCIELSSKIGAEKLKEIAVKDNIAFGADDWDIFANEWNIGKLQEWGMEIPEFKDNSEAEEDDFDIPDPNAVKTDIKLGDIFVIGNHRLICGDSTKIDQVNVLMDGDMADCVVTDPPYNVAIQGGNHGDPNRKNGLKIENDSMGDSDFYNFLFGVYKNLFQVMKPGSPIYVFHADSEGANFRFAMREAGLKFTQCLIWLKNSMVMGRQDYQWKHEPILYGWKEGSAHKWYSDRKQTTILEFDRPSRNAEHPTMKLVKLIAYCIMNSSKKNDIVVDLFGGGGSTMVASQELGRRAYLSEFDPRYCQVIVDRMINLVPGIVITKNGKPYKSKTK